MPASRSIARHEAWQSSTTPCDARPPGPAMGASAGVDFPTSTPFESGGFSYGSQRSSVSRRTSFSGACFLADIAANVPAGPPPMTRTAAGATLHAKGDHHVADVFVGIRHDDH